MSAPFDLSKVLIDWKDAQGFALADAMTGVCVFGATGSGKTSGPGRLIAQSYMKAGMGGLVLCAKAEERSQWQEWAKDAGRCDDLVIFSPQGPHRFDFLEWEAGRATEGGGQVINTVLLLDEIARAAARAGGGSAGSGGGDSAFFEDALHLMLTALVALAIASGDAVTLPRMRGLAASAPRSTAQLKSRDWLEGSAMAQLLARLAAGHQGNAEKRADLMEIFAYWTGDYCTLSDRTRSIIDMMFSMLVTPFLYAPLRRLFTSGSTITPEACFDGAIIVVDLPVQSFRLAGRVAALVWKHCYQIAVMRRSGVRGTLRPVFLWADEAQNFITARDAEYQAVARSARGCTVYLTQQRESVLQMAGPAATESLLANLNLKVFCSNTGTTNTWASALIGEDYIPVLGTSAGHNAAHDPSGPTGDGSGSMTVNRNEQKRAYIEPSRFQSLKRGGPANGLVVEAVVFCGGKMFATADGKPFPYKILNFKQGK